MFGHDGDFGVATAVYPPSLSRRPPSVANGRCQTLLIARTIVGKGHQQCCVPSLDFLPAADAGCFADEKARLGDAPPGARR
ncbi:MAG: hypothetical protein IPH82_29140 [Chloroflexi bacterium]|nr:hypothetical protein [Chloroflexota bacterium]